MMRAAVYRKFGGPINIEDVAIPEVPEGGVLVKVRATGVCRSDWHGWKGHDSDIVEHGLPFVPGHELSGVIEKIGKGTRSLNVGDRVAIPFILSCGSCYACCDLMQPTVCEEQKQPGFTQFGSFAEYVAIPRADRNIRRIPPGVSFVQAAALGCRLTTAYRAIIEQGQLLQDRHETIAVFGCGGLGLSCVMLAAAYGTKNIIACDVSWEALKKAKELGATEVVHATSDNDDVREKVKQQTPTGDGADISVDAAGFAETCENAIYCTKRSGRMVQCGLPLGGRSPTVPMALVVVREIEIIGSHGFNADTLPELLELILSKKLCPEILVEKYVTLKEGAKTIERMDQTSPIGITMVTEFNQDVG